MNLLKILSIGAVFLLFMTVFIGTVNANVLESKNSIIKKLSDKVGLDIDDLDSYCLIKGFVALVLVLLILAKMSEPEEE